MGAFIICSSFVEESSFFGFFSIYLRIEILLMLEIYLRRWFNARR